MSPILVPSMLGAACLAILLPLSFGGPSLLAVGNDALGPLFFIFAATGVMLAAALAYAPNDTLWALMMILGLCVFSTLTLWAIFGMLAGIALIVGLLTLLSAVVLAQRHMVLEHTVHIMVLFGKYHRTLYPGFNLRLPGEQVLTIISTAAVTIEAVARDVALADGQRYDLAATVGCRPMPNRAYLLAERGSDWPTGVRRMLEITLREVLNGLRETDLFDEDGLEGGVSLAMRLRGHLRQLVGGWGVQVEWVHPHDVRPTAPPPTRQPLGASHSGAQPAYPTSLTQSTEQVAMRGVTRGAMLPLPPAMRHDLPTPQALEEAYNAVRERRITDPAMIIQIALSFEAAAADAMIAATLPFDAARAAYFLRQLARQLEPVNASVGMPRATI